MADRKRGRPSLSESARKQRRTVHNILTASSRIFIGDQRERWLDFKKLQGIGSDREALAFLLSFFDKNAEKVTSKL